MKTRSVHKSPHHIIHQSLNARLIPTTPFDTHCFTLRFTLRCFLSDLSPAHTPVHTPRRQASVGRNNNGRFIGDIAQIGQRRQASEGSFGQRRQASVGRKNNGTFIGDELRHGAR
ncbi:hypothetical protein EYF80_058173 [Liparis tanakae]|uniref:Uncharacterized protein n=1 Tax=Liparis tanakae TaxID=230148 RepID=A0A4Z2ERX2_9TELE|nr:hypothetical protein EYF80_058173 [Liparis tanakae]